MNLKQNNTQILLQAKALTKSYQTQWVLRDFSLDIYPGQCIGLVGPNGSGKTTLLELLSGVTRPDKGQISYRGRSIYRQAYRKAAGIVPQHTALPLHLKTEEVLKLFVSLYRIKQPIHELLEQYHLSTFKSHLVKSLSGGQLRRLCLSLALLHAPEIIFMDEPTVGLDKEYRTKFIERLAHLKDVGNTIVFSTHLHEETIQLCDDVVTLEAQTA